MRRTRLVLKDSDQESWCKRYMELYQELRENWERLYWDEGYSKKIAEEHANYESAEDDDADFSPYRRRSADPNRARDSGFGRDNQDPAWERVRHVRDKFEFDRERRMREKAFAPMNVGRGSDFFMGGRAPEPFDARRFAPRSREVSGFNPIERSTNQEPFDPKRFFPGN